MVGKTRAQSAARRGSDATSNRTLGDYIEIRMREVVGFFEAQANTSKAIKTTKAVRCRVDEIVTYCKDQAHQISKEDIGELFRCLDREAMGPRFATDVFILVFRLLDVSEEDSYREEGLKLLLRTARLIMAWSKTDSKHHSDVSLVSMKTQLATELRPLLKGSLLSGDNDERCYRIIEELLFEISMGDEIAITESPINVSDYAANNGTDWMNSVCTNKRRQDMIPDSYEDISIYDFPVDTIEEEFGSRSNTRKAHIVKFPKDGPQTRVAPLKKKPRLRAGRVDAQGSPLEILRSPSIAQNTIQMPRLSPESGVLQGLIPEQKNLLKDANDTPINKGSLVAIKMNSPYSEGKHESEEIPSESYPPSGVECSHADDSLFPQNVAIARSNNRTFSPVLQGSPKARSGPLRADQMGFDRFANHEGSVVIEPKEPKAIFSNPTKPNILKQAAISDIGEAGISPSEVNNDIGLNQEHDVLPFAPGCVVQNHTGHQATISAENSREPAEGTSAVFISSTPEQKMIGRPQISDGIEQSTAKARESLFPNTIWKQVSIDSLLAAKTIPIGPIRRTLQRQKPAIARNLTKHTPLTMRSGLKKPKSQMLKPLELEYIGKVAVEVPNGESPLEAKGVKASSEHQSSQVLPPLAKRLNPQEVSMLEPIPKVDAQTCVSLTPQRRIPRDPDKTLVGLVKSEYDDREPAKLQDSFAISSTTTGSGRSSSGEEDPGLLQDFTHRIQRMDNETLSALEPALVLLLNAFRPLAVTKTKIRDLLGKFEEDIQTAIESYSRYCQDNKASLQEFLTSQIDLQVQQMKDLKALCVESAIEHLPQHHQNSHLINLVDDILSSIHVHEAVGT